LDEGGVLAADLTQAELPPASEPVPRPRARPHRRRFIFIYALLAAVFACGLVGTVVWAGRAISPPPAWSAWKPSGGGLGAAKQIADHVGAAYRLPSGFQLVDVIAKEPTVSADKHEAPLHYIDFRRPRGAGDTYLRIDQSNTLTYSMCGAGPSCSIATGKPSLARGLLVGREILELALYTFKYVGGVDHVIAYLPPAAGKRPTVAIYLDRADFADQLKRPLATTLSQKVPTVSTFGGREARTIDTLLNQRGFNFAYAQTQQGDLVLVLQSPA
jgi:hypothetical protein